jgi:hypothetical protein
MTNRVELEDRTHIITQEEISMLNRLIGRRIMSILSTKKVFIREGIFNEFLANVFLKIEDMKSSLLINSIYDELETGDDFICLTFSIIDNIPTISNEIDLDDFIVDKIEIYSDKYISDVSSNDPNLITTPIKVENENVIIIHSENKKLFVQPEGGAPLIIVSTNDEFIRENLMNSDLTLSRTLN